MTTVIDERVVEMRFNNADFEKNVAQSMNTLDSLKKSLNFDSAKSLENIGKASKNFSLSGITETISEATTKFSALEIAGITAIMNITNKAVDFGINFAKSLSIDQVTSGFDKYATKTQSVQTIMAATADKFSDQAEQMAYVNEQLEKLTWFTDETSYNMVDMTSNIGKFVSNNIELDKAVTAMEGIATWAGLSGAGTQEASRAMYNFSQAMGAGAMKLQDWKSIENANMATTKFKETAIDTAVELGKLTKAADGVVTTLNGKTEVSITSFSESLKQKWFDTDVMTATLNKFGSFADELYNLSNKTGLTASELLEALDDYKAGTLDITELSRECQVSVSDLNKEFSRLTGEGFELGKKAFQASQEAKTFKEAIDSVKDAVSSGWMNTFEILFGNYLEAKKLWTGLANNLYDMFAEGGNKRNEVLAVWKELGGRNSLIMGAVNALNLLIKPFTAIKEAFESILPRGREFGKILNQLTYKFYIFTSRLQPSQEFLNNIYQFFRGIFSVGKLVLSFFSQLISAIVKIVAPAKSLFEIIGNILGKVGMFLQVITVFATESGIIETAITFIVAGLQKLLGVIKTVAAVLASGIFVGIKAFVALIQSAITTITKLVNMAGPRLTKLGNDISAAFTKATSIFSVFNKKGKDTTTVTKTMEKNYGAAGGAVAKFGKLTKDAGEDVAKNTTLIEKLLGILGKAKSVMLSVGTVIGGAILTLGTKIFKFFTDFKTRYQDMTKYATSLKDYVLGVFQTIGSLFGDAWGKIKDFFGQFNIDLTSLQTAFTTIKDGLSTLIDKLGPGRIAAFAFATAMLALVGAAIKLSDSFRSMFGAVTGVFNNINKILKKQFAKSSVVTDLSKAFAIIAGSLTLLAFVDASYHNELENVANIMLKLMVVFTLCAAALRGLDLLLSKFNIDTDFNTINSNILALAGSMTLLAGAFAILNMVELKEDWLKKLGVMAIMFAEVAITAAAISRLAPQLSKGSLILLSLGLSMKLMVDALATIGEKDIDGINKNLVGFTALFIGVAALTAAAGQLKLTSAINLMLVAKALSILLPDISALLKEIAPYVADITDRLTGISIDFTQAKELAKSAFNKANEFFNYLYTRFSETTATILSCFTIAGSILLALGSLAAIVASGFAIAKIISAIGSLGNILKGAGIAVIGLAVAIRIVTSSIIELGEYMKYLTDKQYNRLTEGFAIISLSLIAIIGAATVIDAFATFITKNHIYDGKTVRTQFLGLAMAFVGIGVAMKLIVSALKGLETLNEATFWPVILAMDSMLICLAIVAGASGTITKGGSALLGLIGIATTMALLIAELGVLSIMFSGENENAMSVAIIAMLAIMSGLIVLIRSLARIQKAGPILALTLPVFGTILVIAGMIVTLGALENVNFAGIVAGIGGIATVLVMVMAIVGKLSKMDNLGTGFTNKLKLFQNVIGAVIVIAGMITLLGVAVHFIGEDIVLGVGVLAAAMIGIYKFMENIANMPALGNSLKSKLNLLRVCVLAMIGVMIPIVALAATSRLAGGVHLATSIGVLALGVVALGGLMNYVAKMNGVTNNLRGKIVLLTACTLAMIGVSYALTKLAGIDNPNDSWNSLFVLSLGMAALTGVIWAMTRIMASGDLKRILGSIGMILSATLMVHELASAICKLADVDASQLKAAADAMKAIMIPLGIMTGLLGLLSGVIVGVASVFGSAAGGWAGAAALPLLLVSLGLSVIEMGYGLKIGAVAIEIIAKALDGLADTLKKYGTLEVDKISKNLIELGHAAYILGMSTGPITAFFTALSGLGIMVLAYALSKLNPEIKPFVDNMKTLSELNLSGIAGSLVQLGLAGYVLGKGAFGVGSYALAIGGLAKALGTYQSVMNGGSSGGGPKGVTFEYFDTANESMTQSTNKLGETVTTVTKEVPKNYEDMVVEAAGGVLSKEGELKAANHKVFGEVVSDEEEARLIHNAEVLGYKNVESYIDAIEKGEAVRHNELLTTGEKIVRAVGDGAKETASQVLDELGVDVNGDLSNLGGDITSWLSGLFPEFAKYGTDLGKIFGGNIVYNVMQYISKMKGSFEWMFDQTLKNAQGRSIAQFGANGMDSKAMAAMYNMKGVNQYSTALTNLAKAGKTVGDVTGWLHSDFLGINEIMQTVTETANGTGKAMTGVGEAGGKAGKGVKDLADSLRSGLDLFSKFEVKNEMTSEQLLENMKSNIDGYASWSHRMTVLAERFANNDIPVTLLEKLRDDGPKQQEVMNAIYNMTDEQLAQLRDLYATGMTLPESQAAIVGSAFTYMGEMATQGFSDALNDHKAAHEAAHGLGQAAIDGVAEGIDAHSPSRKTFALGVFMTDGLALGMVSDSAIAMLELCVSQLTSRIFELFDENLKPETMSLVGENMLNNLFSNSLSTMVTADNPIISAFANSLMQIDPILEALTFFVETILEQINIAFGMADSESNSEVFYGYGRGSVQGFANGISMNLGFIHTQIIIMGMKVVGWLGDEKFADKFYDIGKNATIGFANGLADSKAAEKVMENAGKIADSARKKMKEALDEESPSKVTRQIGMYASMGLAIGITDGAKNVADAAESVASGAAEGMMDANGRIQDILNSELDFNPIITPMLDLSLLRSQIGELNALIAGNNTMGYGQNGGQFTANGTQPASINFTQNNYSPKELSRYDIYRNTKNQISMMKGVIAHA